MQRLYLANSGSNNGTHNRSIFTITQTLFPCLNISLSLTASEKTDSAILHLLELKTQWKTQCLKCIKQHK